MLLHSGWFIIFRNETEVDSESPGLRLIFSFCNSYLNARVVFCSFSRVNNVAFRRNLPIRQIRQHIAKGGNFIGRTNPCRQIYGTSDMSQREYEIFLLCLLNNTQCIHSALKYNLWKKLLFYNLFFCEHSFTAASDHQKIQFRPPRGFDEERVESEQVDSHSSDSLIKQTTNKVRPKTRDKCWNTVTFAKKKNVQDKMNFKGGFTTDGGRELVKPVYSGLGEYGVSFASVFTPFFIHPCLWNRGIYPVGDLSTLRNVSPHSLYVIHSTVQKMRPSSHIVIRSAVNPS